MLCDMLIEFFVNVVSLGCDLNPYVYGEVETTRVLADRIFTDYLLIKKVLLFLQVGRIISIERVNG